MNRECSGKRSDLGLAEDLYQSVYDSLPSAICVVYGEGRILHLNPALERMLGCRLLEKRGQRRPGP